MGLCGLGVLVELLEQEQTLKKGRENIGILNMHSET